MLRRRLLMNMLGGFRWSISKVSIRFSQKSTPSTSIAEEATAKRTVAMGKTAIATGRPAADGASTKSMIVARKTEAESVIPVQGKTFMGIIVECLSNAYSALEAPGNGAWGILMGRFANAVGAAGKVASRRNGIVIDRKAGAESADVEEANSKWSSNIGVLANPDISDAQEAVARRTGGMGRSAVSIYAPTIPVADYSGVQTINNAKAALSFENYMDGDVLVLQQVFYAEVIDGVLEVS